MLRVLLQCEDRYFIQSFSNFASARCQDIEFICFIDAEKARDHIKNTRLRLDAILAEQELLDDLPETKAIRLRVAEQTAFKDPEAIAINIYQAGSAIISDVRSALALQGKGALGGQAGKKDIRIVSCYSTQGGSGKSTLGYALALAAVREGHQALYFDLEPFPCPVQREPHTFRSSLDELLFNLKDGRDLAPVVLDTIERDKNRVMVLPPFHTAGDLLSLSSDQLQKMLEALVENADVEYIFLDLPVGFSAHTLWALEASTCILQIYTDDFSLRCRLEQIATDVYYQNLPGAAMALTVLNRCHQKGTEPGIDAKIPFSESLQQGKLISDVMERNPAFLQSCTDLLDKIK